MKVEKKIQKIADESLQEYDNKEFLAELKQQYYYKEHTMVKPGKRKLISIVCSAAAALIVTIVGLIVFLPRNAGEEHKNYLRENAIMDYATLADINGSLANIKFAGLQYSQLLRIYDKEYDDTLYYILQYQDESTFEIIKLNLCVNKNYNYPWDKTLNNLTGEVKGYTVNYSNSCEEEEELYFYKNDGYIETENETIYIEYEGVGFEEDSSNFLNFLQGLIA